MTREEAHNLLDEQIDKFGPEVPAAWIEGLPSYAEMTACQLGICHEDWPLEERAAFFMGHPSAKPQERLEETRTQRELARLQREGRVAQRKMTHDRAMNRVLHWLVARHLKSQGVA